MDLTRYADDYWSQKDDRVDYDRLRHLLSFAPKTGRALVIDGGPGMLAVELRQLGHEVVNTDASALAMERSEAKGLTSLAQDLDNGPLPLPDASFDLVVSDSAIEHRFHSLRALDEASRLLLPGGTFLLLVPNIAHWRYRLALLFGRFPEIEGAASDRCHLRFFALPELKRELAVRSLSLQRVSGFASLWVKGLYPRVLRAPLIRNLYGGLVWLRPSLFGRDLILVAKKPTHV